MSAQKPTMTTVDTTAELSVSGYYQPAIPERGPSYSSGGEPGEPAGWSDVTVMLFGFELEMWPELRTWAEGQLDQVRGG